LQLDKTAVAQIYDGFWNDTSPTSTDFTVGDDSEINDSGSTYVAYLFAHDDGGFGDDGLQNVISCGSFVGTGSLEIDLGWEPQWVLMRSATTTTNWWIFDAMRGMTVGIANGDKFLSANLSAAEDSANAIDPTPTGFKENGSIGGTIIYIAIRRGPMRVPESGTEVFEPTVYSSGSDPSFSSSFPVDMAIWTRKDPSTNRSISSRLTQGTRMYTHSTSAEIAQSAHVFDYMDGWLDIGTLNSSYVSWMFRRAPGFFDVACYTGTGVTRTLNHNLGVVPELVIVKLRSTTSNWLVGFNFSGIDFELANFNNTNAATTYDYATIWGQPTATTITLSGTANNSGVTGVCYLFASLAGISKVGTYTGTGTTLAIDCGFSAGARFVLIKRTDSTGDWYVWDTARGIVSGDDPYLELNTTDAEVTNTDYIDPSSAGFEISSTAPAAINASGGNFLFFAVA
jgi:hypothetical protein